MERTNFGSNQETPQSIRILEEGITRKYVITNISDIKIGVMNIKATNECRWIVNVKSILTTGYIFEIYTLESVITDTNNPMIKDVAQFNNAFKEVYNELVLEVDFKGQLIAVKNACDIRRKWLRIRSQLQEIQAQNENVASVIQLNDDLFDSDKNLFEVIKAMEFFELFFIGFYGRSMPWEGIEQTRSSKFRGAKLNWIYNFYQDHTNLYNQNAPNHLITMSGAVNQNLNESFVKAAYGDFEFIDYKKLRPQIICEGSYLIDKKSGMLEQSTYKNEEIVDAAFLYSKNSYSIKPYE